MSSVRETVDVENSGATVTLQKPGDDTVNVRVNADAAIDATLHVNDREGTTDAFEDTTYGARTDIDDTGRDITEPYVIFEVTTGTATAGDSAEVFLSSE